MRSTDRLHCTRKRRDRLRKTRVTVRASSDILFRPLGFLFHEGVSPAKAATGINLLGRVDPKRAAITRLAK